MDRNVNPNQSPRRSHWPLSILASVVSLINMVFPILMARKLTLDVVGIHRLFFFYLQSIPAFSLSLGFLNGLPFWAGQGKMGPKLIANAGGLLFQLSLFVSLLLWVFKKPFAQFLGFEDHIAVLFTLASLPILFSMFYENAEIATHHIWKGSVFSAFFELLRLGSMMLALVYYTTLESILIAHLIVSWLKVLISICLGLRSDLFRFFPERKWLSQIAKYAIPASWASLFDQLIVYPDKYILSSFLSKAEFAVYSVGCFSIPPLHIFEESVNKVLIPQISHHFVKSEIPEAIHKCREAIIELMLFLIPATVGLILFSKPIIELLFTERFSEAHTILQIYALSYLMMGIPHDIGFRARGDSRWILYTRIGFSFLTILFVYIGTQLGGMKGALWAGLLGKLILRIYSLKELKKRLKFQWPQLLPFREFNIFLFCSFFWAGICLVLKSSFASERSWFIFGSLSFSVGYLTFVHFLGEGALTRSWTLFSKRRS